MRSRIVIIAVARLLACEAPAPVWNDENFGGYLVWRGEARYTVGIDGRAETLCNDQVVDSYIRAFLRQQGRDVAVQQFPAQYTLIPRTAWAYSALPTGLLRDAPAPIDALPAWRQVYGDDQAVLAVRESTVWSCPCCRKLTTRFESSSPFLALTGKRGLVHVGPPSQ